MAVYAFAPVRALALGCAVPEVGQEGACFVCAATPAVRVVVRPQSRDGVSVRIDVISPQTDGCFAIFGATPEHHLFRAITRYFGVDGLEAEVRYELPPECGLGLRAAAAVALVGATALTVGRQIPPEQVAMLAQQCSQQALGAPHDDMAAFLIAAHGGAGLWRVAPFPRPLRQAPRYLPHVLSALERRLLIVRVYPPEGLWCPPIPPRLATGSTLCARLLTLAGEAASALARQDFAALGALLVEQGAARAQLGEGVLGEEVRDVNAIARTHGAYGALTHADGVAITVLCPPEARAALAADLERAGHATLTTHVTSEGMHVWGEGIGSRPHREER